MVLGYEESFVCNAVTGQETADVFGTPLRGGPIAISPDGGVYAQCDEQAIQVRHLNGDDEDLDSFSAHAFSLAFSPDGQLLAVGLEEDLLLRRWSAKKTVTVIPFDEDQSPRSLAFDPSGDRLLIGMGEAIVEFDSVMEFEGPDTPQGRTQRNVHLCDLKSSQIEQLPLEHVGNIYAVGFSPGAEHAVSAGRDGVVRFCDLATRKTVVSFEAHLGQILSLTFSPDGNTLATAGTDGTIRLWPWRELLDA